jgi:Holliday junction DNA helicase RuvB
MTPGDMDGSDFGSEEPESVNRTVTAGRISADGDLDNSLRPKSLGDFIGQPRVCEQLELVLQAARGRGGTPDHILLSGPPGLGKTSLAMIIAGEMGAALRVTSGPALERAGDLAAMLSNLVASHAPPKRCSTSPWRTSVSMSSSEKVRVPPPFRSTSHHSPWSAPPPGRAL